MRWKYSTYRDRAGREHTHAACIVSDDGAYTINRAPQHGFCRAATSERPADTITYMLVHNGAILHVEHGVANTPAATQSATKALTLRALAHSIEANRGAA